MTDARPIQPQRAMYFPHAEFVSTAWVKSALLYWEGLVRWRPRGSAPRDDREISQLLDAQLIAELSPEPERLRAAPQIGQRLEDLLVGFGGSFPPCLPWFRGMGDIAPEREERDRAEIMAALEGRPLARKAFAERPDQARALLLTLWAEEVAEERRFAAVTDEPILDAVSLHLEHERVTDDPQSLAPGHGQVIAELALPAPSLEALAQLPVERLLSIRKRYAHKRRHFRETVQSRVAAIAELRTPQAIEEQLEALREETRDDLEATREAVKNAKVRDRWTLLGVTAPASLAAALSIAAYSPVLGPAGGVGAIALGVTSWFVQKRAGSPAPANHYLLSLDDALAATPWQRVTRALRDIRHG